MSRRPAASSSKYELNIPKSVNHQSKYRRIFWICLLLLRGKNFKIFREKSASWQMAPKAIRELKNPASPLLLLCTVGNACSVWRTCSILKFCHIWGWFPREKWKENKIPQPNLSEVSQSCTEKPSSALPYYQPLQIRKKKKKSTWTRLVFYHEARQGFVWQEGGKRGCRWGNISSWRLLHTSVAPSTPIRVQQGWLGTPPFTDDYRAQDGYCQSVYTSSTRTWPRNVLLSLTPRLQCSG